MFSLYLLFLLRSAFGCICLLDFTFCRHSPHFSMHLFVSPRLPPPNCVSTKNIAPQVIGRGGQTVNKLMKDSKAKIVVKPYPDRSGNDVIITGTASTVNVSCLLLRYLREVIVVFGLCWCCYW